jgi:hypothetical protein
MTTLYEKRGRRYVALNDPYAMDGLQTGVWLVTVAPGRHSARRLVTPDYAALEAAADTAKDAMCEAMQRCSEYRAPSWAQSKNATIHFIEAYRKKFGPQSLMMERVSVMDIIEAGFAALVQAAKTHKEKRK